jgi:hypothetical protein
MGTPPANIYVTFYFTIYDYEHISSIKTHYIL